jgi:gluconokinase
MGVAGCGKTTVGKELALRLKLPFSDGDQFHPKANIDKMSRGIPLDDNDRLPWLGSIAEYINETLDSGAVIACSALKQRYRDILIGNHGEQVRFVYLKISRTAVYERLKARKDHFMPPELIDSQFAALEEPVSVITISAEKSVDDIIEEIVEELNKKINLKATIDH